MYLRLGILHGLRMRYMIFQKSKPCRYLIWSLRDDLTPLIVIAADQIHQVYWNRSINEIGFGRDVKDRKIEMLELTRNFKKIQNADTKIKMH